jgi:hypothetical protein
MNVTLEEGVVAYLDSKNQDALQLVLKRSGGG